MTYYNPGGCPEYVEDGQAFTTADGTNYPGNWLSLAGPPVGVTEVSVEPQPSYDPSTQVAEAVMASPIVRSWVVRDKTNSEKNAPILRQIESLEASVTPRRIREAALTDAGKVWLAGVDSQIAALRTQLV